MHASIGTRTPTCIARILPVAARIAAARVTIVVAVGGRPEPAAGAAAGHSVT